MKNLVLGCLGKVKSLLRRISDWWKQFRYKAYVVVGGIVLIIVFALSLKWLFPKKSVVDVAPPAVTASKAVFGPVTKYVNAIGTLRPFDSVVIKSEVNGCIKDVCFTEGTAVQEGDLLVALEDSAARAALAEAEAQFRKAESECKPVEKLTDKGVFARVQRDMKKAEMEVCEARVASCKSNLEKHKIHAPFGGIVGLKEISKGQVVSVGSDLVKLVDCHPLKVDFKVAELDIGNIYVGQVITILVGGDKDQEYSAKITAIDPESDRITHTFNVRAELDVPEGIAMTSQTLKPGRFVSVKAEINGDQQGIVIPESALDKVGDEDIVYRVVDGLAIRTPVTVGTRKDGNVEIITGVNENDLVITGGQSNVLDGRAVSIQDGHSTEEIAKAMQQFYNRARKK